MTHLGSAQYVVLDDDPTGVQGLEGIRVLLGWDAMRVREALDGRPAVHLITNARAVPRDQVETLIEGASRAALAGVPEARIVLRGDSTLRGHLLEEYTGVRNATSPSAWPALLLIPALPSAGRVTVGGVHLYERDGVRIPLHHTEYARDGVFAYHSSRLLEWAEERSDGLFPAREGRELPLDALRSGGPDTVSDILSILANGATPRVFAPDAETDADLKTIAAGYRAAAGAGATVIVRCGPAFAGIVAGTAAPDFTTLPAAGAGVLVVCGSYVPQTTRQLARLVADRPGTLVEADVQSLGGDARKPEIERLATEASRRLHDGGIAVVATQRARPEGLMSLAAGERVILGLARAVRSLETRPSVIVAKGGITAAVTLRDGVGADEANVLGPVEPGVSRWAARWPDGDPLDYLVVPGNVGDDEQLVRLVNGIMGGSTSC